MRPLSQEVKYRRWKFIIHILRKDYNNDLTFPGHLKAEEREKDPKQYGEEQSEEERGKWIEILG